LLFHLFGVALGLAAALLAGAPAAADPVPQVTIRAGKAGSAYNLLLHELVEAIGADPKGALVLELEESQSSVQNVMEAAKRAPNEIFTATPSVVRTALRREKPFDAKTRYENIRALFPIPFQSVHWVVRDDAGVRSWADLTGKTLITGVRGSLGERHTAAVLDLLGLEGKVGLLDLDTTNAPAALREGKVTGFTLVGPFPIASLVDLARTVPLRLLGLDGDRLTTFLAGDDTAVPVVIPADTYPGVSEDVPTIALPVGAYTTTKMNDAAAYALTKLFWTHKAVLGRDNPHWQTITPATLSTLGVKLHRGALRYYKESGVSVPKSLQ